ncbi:MAG: helix-turn-helix domain-containing protein [Aliifodinibius sp.]|nr:helix-turn-helix domain-containing protein [Fodinibius sp.]
MEELKPLAKFPVINTSHVEKAEFCISQSIADAQIDRVGKRHNFRLELNAVNLHSVSLVYNFFGAHTKLSTCSELDSAIFVTALGIPIALNIDNETHLVSRNKAVFIGPAKKVRIERPARSEILYLRVPLSDLRNNFEKLTAKHNRGPLVFNRKVNVVRGSGAMLKGLMDYLVNLFAVNDSVLAIPAIRKSFDDLLMTALLTLPHNKVDHLYEDRTGMVAPAIVRRAEEYMRANLEKPLNIHDLVRICDCSRSVLFSAFRNARNYTPMEFLTEQRLHHAREQLLKSNYNVSVLSIASNCGFVSHSWFSQVYKKRFGERPSDTLRKSK